MSVVNTSKETSWSPWCGAPNAPHQPPWAEASLTKVPPIIIRDRFPCRNSLERHEISRPTDTSGSESLGKAFLALTTVLTMCPFDHRVSRPWTP
jgi:hypothetical protein